MSVRSVGWRERPRLAPAALVIGAGALAAIAASSHISHALLLAAGGGWVGLVVLLRMPRQRALGWCIIGASFFSGTQLKLGQLDVTDILLLTAAVLLVLKREAGGELPRPASAPRTLLLGLGLVVFGGIVGSLFEPPSFSAVFRVVVFPVTKLFFLSPRYGEIVRLVYGTVGVVLLVRAARLTGTQFRHALTAFCLGATVSALWGVLNPTAMAGRAAGLTSHPVYLGWISGFAAALGVGLVLSRAPALRLIGLATVVAGVAGIAVSGTRSGVLILLAGLVVLQFGLRSARRTVTFLLLGLVVASLVVIGVGGDTPVSTRLAGSASAVASNQQRDLLREDSFALVRKHGWTGVGLRYLLPPHNLVLGVLAATGAIGFIGLLIVVGSLVRRLITTPPTEVLSIAVLSAAVGTYACMWFVNVGWDRWFWVPIALAIARPLSPAVGQRAEGQSSVQTIIG